MRLLVLAAALTTAAGCGESGPPTGKVSGAVTLDGKPLDTGRMRFVSKDGKSPPVETAVTAGRYAAEVPVGEVRVEINSEKVVGQRRMYETPDSPMVDVGKEQLPAKYHSNSELKLTVARGDNPPADFDLKSK